MKCRQYDFTGSMYGDKSNTVIFDNSLLHRLVPSFRVERRFDQRVRESAEYFLSHPEMQVEYPDFDRFTEQIIAIMDEAERKAEKL